MSTLPDAESSSGDDSNLDGVRAALIVGCIMVAVYLLSTALGEYERSLLNAFYPYSSQFAFLRAFFPSPWSTDLIDWQSVVLLQAVPFLLFFDFAVRMRIDPLGRVIPTVVAIAAVGACLSVVDVIISAYQSNIASLLLNGSLAVPNGFQSESLSTILVSVLSPLPLWNMLRNAVVFAALGMTGIAFGSFSGETPYWILRGWLASRGQSQEEVLVSQDASPLSRVRSISPKGTMPDGRLRTLVSHRSGMAPRRQDHDSKCREVI